VSWKFVEEFRSKRPHPSLRPLARHPAACRGRA
jgi:hypothetical protein